MGSYRPDYRLDLVVFLTLGHPGLLHKIKKHSHGSKECLLPSMGVGVSCHPRLQEFLGDTFVSPQRLISAYHVYCI